MSSLHSSPTRRAFTLVEILVVLAIVLLLAAMLMSVFGKVRNSAHSVTCANNLRQIGVAFRLYLSDSHNFYPSVTTHVTSKGTALCAWTHSLAPYVKDTTVFNCPSDVNQYYVDEPLPVTHDDDGTRYYDGGYLINAPNGADKTIFNDHEIRRPSQMILVVDGINDLGCTRPIPGIGPLTPKDIASMDIRLRHDNGVNALFADGHVKRQSASELLDRAQWTLSGTDAQPTPLPWPTLTPTHP